MKTIINAIERQMKDPVRSGSRRIAMAIGGALMVLGWIAGTFLLHPDQVCAREQKNILLHDTYAQVPERANYAANMYCRRRNNIPGRVELL